MLFRKRIESLITNLEQLFRTVLTNSLEQLFNKLKDEIMKKFDEKISEENAKLKNSNRL